MPWSALLAEPGLLEFVRVAPDHPLYVLYSSGTTGLPKPIVHGHGGVLVEHLKVIGLHSDMGPNDRFFWFTTTGWMMWNYVVSGLLVGAQLVMFDGDPNHDGPDTLWRMAADERITWFGGGAPFFVACKRAGLRPVDTLDLSALRAVGSTGAPLPADAFRWIYAAVSPDVLVSPISGGTDVCSAFVGGSPMTPVWEGEIPCSYLGAAEIYRVVEAVDGVVDSLVVHLEAPDADDPGTLVLFVVTDGRSLDDGLAAAIRATVRRELSPRHVPDEVHDVAAIPTTLSGKKLELPVKKILLGRDPDQVASRGALRDPAALDAIVRLARSR